MNKPKRRKGKIIIDLDKKTGSKIIDLFQRKGGTKKAFSEAKERLYGIAKKLGEKYGLEPAGYWYDDSNDKFTLEMKKVSKDKVDDDFAEAEEGKAPNIPTPEAVDDKKKTKKQPTSKDKVEKEKDKAKKDMKEKYTPQEALDMINDILSKVKKVSKPKGTRLGVACRRASTNVRKLAAVFNVLDELETETAYDIIRGARVRAMMKHFKNKASGKKGVNASKRKFVRRIKSARKKKSEYNPVIDTDVKAKPPYDGDTVKAQEGGENKQEDLVHAQEKTTKPSLSKKPEMALSEKTPSGTKKGTKEIVADIIEKMEAKELVKPEEISGEKKTLASMNTRQLNILKKQIDESGDDDGCFVRNGQFVNLPSILN